MYKIKLNIHFNNFSIHMNFGIKYFNNLFKQSYMVDILIMRHLFDGFDYVFILEYIIYFQDIQYSYFFLFNT